ncbi:MAG TPA: Nramp family divalent metal transporter, partial [Acidisoma sp.]|nr:Nramp family divalent metal transporter [Acidisoma sp.]
TYSPATTRLLWISCEFAIVATDLAEVIGSAIALKLLFGLPLLAGICVAAVATLAILGIQKANLRKLEAFVIMLTGVVGACFFYELWLSAPPVGELMAATVFSPNMPHGPLAVYLALGILGATVMPHNLYLQSALYTRRREGSRREAVRFASFDCATALALAALINAAILITAASAFHLSGHAAVAGIEEAYRLLSPALGAGLASILFAVALLAAGQSSALTVTLAGQVVTEGFLDWRVSPSVKRLLTRCLAIIPAAAVAALAGDGSISKLLVLSQVVLSLQLGFAVVPLVRFTNDRDLMGDLANGRWERWTGRMLAAVIIAANLGLLLLSFS